MSGGVAVSVAFGDGPLVASPSWTALTDTANLITGFTISRGRRDEFERTGTGEATVSFADTEGVFDQTNASSPYFGGDSTTQVGKQTKLELRDPVADTFTTIFRGVQLDYDQELDPSQKVSFGTIPLVDGLDYLNEAELRVLIAGDGDGDTPPQGAEGNVYYSRDLVNTVDARINQILDDVDWPPGPFTGDRRSIFTGNVHLVARSYSPGSNALTAIQDAADAEFPGIANFYMSKDNVATFHGRLARFDPTNPDYDINIWKAGDGAAILADSDYAQIRALAFGNPREYIVNSALFTPQGIKDADIAAMLAEDPTSQTNYGLHSKSADNLCIDSSVLTGNNARDECVLYGNYWVATHADPHVRVNRIAFRSLAPDDPRAAKTWALICGVEISDIIRLKTTHPGGGGFDDADFFVEGINYDITPLQPGYADVTLTLDVTPRSYYDFEWT